MKGEDIKEVVERHPFRPFTIRLNNGKQYTFSEPRNFGVPKNYRVIYYFGDADWVMLDLDSIGEIIHQ